MKLSTVAVLSAVLALSMTADTVKNVALSRRGYDVDCDDDDFGYGDNTGDHEGGYDSEDDDQDDSYGGGHGGSDACNAAIGNKVIAVFTKTVRVRRKFTYIRFRYWAWVCKNGQRKRVAAARNPILKRVKTTKRNRNRIGKDTRTWIRTRYNGAKERVKKRIPRGKRGKGRKH